MLGVVRRRLPPDYATPHSMLLGQSIGSTPNQVSLCSLRVTGSMPQRHSLNRDSQSIQADYMIGTPGLVILHQSVTPHHLPGRCTGSTQSLFPIASLNPLFYRYCICSFSSHFLAWKQDRFTSPLHSSSKLREEIDRFFCFCCVSSDSKG